ncbi:hypothetical protein [Candidatus Liberibacter americanus]|uniref:Uncharacterized protein n=1 Tax=Candidatus Liberibacter americanus str. Sao Paulo TaxID=1261131 RepID=U6B8E0_9HYPH|nr:hypothetical protein [Candidatus Liberibacter americanus]AHA28002.1 hypothetical protein lam_656 [Candidatus Liberibacter americanus str. Sao Paulo]EMS35801.1 hypothetical protein G653_04851 [Candidatus Liberibacter americanus PW_SP]
MSNGQPLFKVYTRTINEAQEDMLFIRLKLGSNLSKDTLRHIELEAKDAVLEHLTQLKETIKLIIDKRVISSDAVSNLSNEEDCEACQ